MLDVNFENIIYLSPLVAVFNDVAIIKNTTLENLDRILEMCGMEYNLSIPIREKDNYKIYPVQTKE